MSATLKNAIRAVNRTALMLGSISTLAISSAALAQEDGALMEEIEVTGIRGALKQAIDTKRFSNAGVDSVSAEDVGKFPDSDVGEALGRIPGVSVGRAFGQGAAISIRGADAQMTLTSLNGQSVASTGWFDQQAVDRSFNYSLLPSELIGGIDVYKTTRADIAEGGIGGTVVVNTRKPLDMDANTIFASVKGAYGTVSEDWTPELSGLYSWKNDSETFGVLVAGSFSEGDYIRKGTEADNRWAGDVAPTTFVQERERTALDLNVQWAPTDALTFGLHAMTLELVGDNSNTSHYLFPEQVAGNCTSRNMGVVSGFNPNGMCLVSDTTQGGETEAFIQTWARTSTMTSDTFALDAAFEGNGFSIEAVLGRTEAEGGTEMTTNFSYFGGNLPKWNGYIDGTGKQIKINPTSDQSFTTDHLPTEAGPAGSWATTMGPNSDEEDYFQLDATFDMDLGVINSFKTGVRTTSHTFEKEVFRSVFKADGTTAPIGSLYSGKMDIGSWTAPKPDIGAMMDLTNANISHYVEERPGYGKIEEDNVAVYAMVDFEGEGFRGNVGLRYIETDAASTSYDPFGPANLAAGDVAQNAGWGTNKIKDSASYSDVLPSFNVSFDLTDDLLLRAYAGQAITRANYDNMFLGSQTGFQDTVAGNETVNRGGPYLLPQKSSQADIGLEYYYGEGNMVSITYFTKDINNFISTDTSLDQQIGVVSPDSGQDSWTVNEFVNSGGGEIDGVELQLNHGFDNGFGVAANYTYSDASAPAESFSDRVGDFTMSSEHNANLVGYWENDAFSARAAYNWRSEYMVRETGWYGNRYHDDFGTLDLSLGWNVTDNVKVSLEATNILEEDDVQYGAADSSNPEQSQKDPLQDGYPAWSFEGEAVYKLGVSMTF
jgi:iron complex outermembrane receptor protein